MCLEKSFHLSIDLSLPKIRYWGKMEYNSDTYMNNRSLLLFNKKKKMLTNVFYYLILWIVPNVTAMTCYRFMHSTHSASISSGVKIKYILNSYENRIEDKICIVFQILLSLKTACSLVHVSVCHSDWKRKKFARYDLISVYKIIINRYYSRPPNRQFEPILSVWYLII